MANLRVKLYRALKSNGWKQRPVPKKELKALQDLPQGEGKFYLSYQVDGKRKMEPVDRFADAAKSALTRKETELSAKSRGVEIELPAVGDGPKTLAQWREEFLTDKKTTYKKDGSPLNPDTIKSYEDITAEFLAITKRTYPAEVTKQDLKNWMVRLRKGDEDHAAIVHNTVCNYYIFIACFLHFCGVDHKKLLPQSERPTPVEETPEAYTKEEMTKFMFVITNERDALAFELFLTSGPREQELANLEWSHLDLDSEHPTVSYKTRENFRTKTGKSRSVPLEAAMTKKLKAWKKKSTTRLVFPTEAGKIEGHFHRICLKYAVAAGLNPDSFWLHKFRDTFATWALRGGSDIRAVQHWLGHASIVMTQKYLAPAEGKLAQQYINQAFGDWRTAATGATVN